MKRFGLCGAAAVVCSLAWAAMGVSAGQSAGNPTRDDKTVTNGAPKRAMTFADLMAMKRVSDPQISPSGKWVMFSVTDVSLEKNTKVNHLWVVALEGGAVEGQKQIPFGNDKQNDEQKDEQNDKQNGKQKDEQNDKRKDKQNDEQKGRGERQVTFGDGESFGRFSPDGKWVSISMKDQIYLAPWDEAAGTVGEARELTHVAGGGADGAVWSPNSKRLMFTADVWPECSAATEMQTAWREEDACDQQKDEAAAAGSKGQVWDALLYRHWDHFVGGKRSHVLVVSATDGDAVRDLTPASAVGTVEVPTFFLGAPQEYAWAPDSQEVAYVAKLDKVPAASTNNDIYTLRLDEPGAKAVKVSTSPGSDDEPEYSPDGKWLAWRSQKQAGFESDKFRLVVMDRGTKAIREVTKNWDLWIDEFAWAPDSARVYFASGHTGEEPIYETDIAGPIAGQVAGIVQSGEFSEIQVSPDGKALVMSGMRVDMPTRIVSMPIDIPVDKLSPLSHLNDALLGRLNMPPLESFAFTGAEGTKVEGFLLKPPGFDPAKKYPVKFLMHGGPQTAWGDAWSYRWNWELMAASGYVVIGINRRGSTGYGQKFVDEVSGDWGGRAYVDLMKGLDYAEAKYPFIDKRRECALGASYGGFMANWVLTHTNRFKCIVTHDGMYDPVSAYGATEEMWFNEWEFRRPEDFPKGWDGFSAAYDPMGHVTPDPTHRDKAAMNGAPALDPTHRDKAAMNGAPATTEILTKGQNDGQGSAGHPAQPWRYQNLPADEDPFRKWSPMRFIENAKTPTLVIHSQKDMRLDVSQGYEMFTALQRLGVPSKMLYFPDEGHWVLKPQNAELWNEVVGDWCDKWTKTGKYAEK